MKYIWGIKPSKFLQVIKKVFQALEHLVFGFTALLLCLGVFAVLLRSNDILPGQKPKALLLLFLSALVWMLSYFVRSKLSSKNRGTTKSDIFNKKGENFLYFLFSVAFVFTGSHILNSIESVGNNFAFVEHIQPPQFFTNAESIESIFGVTLISLGVILLVLFSSILSFILVGRISLLIRAESTSATDDDRGKTHSLERKNKYLNFILGVVFILLFLFIFLAPIFGLRSLFSRFSISVENLLNQYVAFGLVIIGLPYLYYGRTLFKGIEFNFFYN